jgi:hypothetical protein
MNHFLLLIYWYVNKCLETPKELTEYEEMRLKRAQGIIKEILKGRGYKI